MGHGCHDCGSPNSCECPGSFEDWHKLFEQGKITISYRAWVEQNKLGHPEPYLTNTCLPTPETHTDDGTGTGLVKEFHKAFEQPIFDKPNLTDDKLNWLRLDLLEEETDELRVALENRDVVAVLDALTDLQYVLDGAYVSLGLHRWKDAAMREVHRSNMSKLGADGKPVKRADGKVLKGPGYSPPNLQRVLGDE